MSNKDGTQRQTIVSYSVWQPHGLALDHSGKLESLPVLLPGGGGGGTSVIEGDRDVPLDRV